jgi:hypothetical protein
LEDALLSDFFDEPEEPESEDFDDDEPPSELELELEPLLESDEEELEEDSLLLELSLASFISRERWRVP